jgi:hypothetical protein
LAPTVPTGAVVALERRAPLNSPQFHSCVWWSMTDKPLDGSGGFIGTAARTGQADLEPLTYCKSSRRNYHSLIPEASFSGIELLHIARLKVQ